MKEKFSNILKDKKNLKILIIIGIFIIGTFFCLCFFKKSNEISFDSLISIVEENGANMNWKTFKKYKYTESQDGLIYRTYDVEGNYKLVISGKSLDKSPWSFTLENTKNGKYIDIISQDIVSFLGDDY